MAESPPLSPTPSKDAGDEEEVSLAGTDKDLGDEYSFGNVSLQ
jgi:hypothetical protein